MKGKHICMVVAMLSAVTTKAQHFDSLQIVQVNKQAGDYVVQRKVAELAGIYGDDFVFSHGTGLVEGKKEWLAAVARNTYTLREHDSVTVEMHPALGILRGKLMIERVDRDKTARYQLKYIRIYARRNEKWLMISHITTLETHLN